MIYFIQPFQVDGRPCTGESKEKGALVADHLGLSGDLLKLVVCVTHGVCGHQDIPEVHDDYSG